MVRRLLVTSEFAVEHRVYAEPSSKQQVAGSSPARGTRRPSSQVRQASEASCGGRHPSYQRGTALDDANNASWSDLAYQGACCAQRQLARKRNSCASDSNRQRFTAIMRVVVAHDESGSHACPGLPDEWRCALGSLGRSEDGGLWTALPSCSAVVDMVVWRTEARSCGDISGRAHQGR